MTGAALPPTVKDRAHGTFGRLTARLGSIAAAEVITHMGARPVTPLHKLAPDVL